MNQKEEAGAAKKFKGDFNAVYNRTRGTLEGEGGKRMEGICVPRGLQRDVFCLRLPIAPSIRVRMWRDRGGVAGSQPMSTAVHIT